MDVVDESSLLTDQFSKPSAGAGNIDAKTNALCGGGYFNSISFLDKKEYLNYENLTESRSGRLYD